EIRPGPGGCRAGGEGWGRQWLYDDRGIPERHGSDAVRGLPGSGEQRESVDGGGGCGFVASTVIGGKRRGREGIAEGAESLFVCSRACNSVQGTARARRPCHKQRGDDGGSGATGRGASRDLGFPSRATGTGLATPDMWHPAGTSSLSLSVS